VTDSCASCFYFLSPGTAVVASGLCRRQPPVNDLNGTGSWWPAVQPTDWCGGFSAGDPDIYANQISWGFGSLAPPTPVNVGDWYIQQAVPGGTVVVSTAVLGGPPNHLFPVWAVVYSTLQT
jgi:hypothetical protein